MRPLYRERSGAARSGAERVETAQRTDVDAVDLGRIGAQQLGGHRAHLQVQTRWRAESEAQAQPWVLTARGVREA